MRRLYRGQLLSAESSRLRLVPITRMPSNHEAELLAERVRRRRQFVLITLAAGVLAVVFAVRGCW
jgi:hypothetical protein